MNDPLEHARATAHRWRQANILSGADLPAGVVIVLDGHFVGHLSELPPAGEWAAGCLAVAVDGNIHLARPVDFRGGLEWADLGDALSPAPPETADEVDTQPPENF